MWPSESNENIYEAKQVGPDSSAPPDSVTMSQTKEPEEVKQIRLPRFCD
jgi:hypothetical protein